MLFQKLLGAFPVQTGFPLVNSPTLTLLGQVTSIVVNLPSNIVAGNGLIIIVTQYNGGTFTTPTGWTLINSTKNTGSAGPRTAVYARVATGTEGATVTVVSTSLEEATAIAFRVTNWFGAITAGIEATAIQETTTTPNPPSETASWGSADNLWIAYVGSRGSRTLTAYPTNYNLYQTQALNPVNSNRGETFMAGRELATATEDPGAFSFDSTSREVVSGTLAIRPLPVGSKTITFVASAVVQASNTNGTSTSVTLPASIQENDIIVVFCETGTSNSATAPTQTTPTGYTLIDSAVASNTPQADAGRSNLYHKIAVSSDAGATLTITHGTSNFRATIVAVFRASPQSYPIINIRSINSYGVTTTTTQAANPPNQTVTSSSGVAPLIVFGAYSNYATRTFTPTQDGDITSTNTRSLRYKIYNSSPVDVTVGSTTTGTVVTMQSFYMEIS